MPNFDAISSNSPGISMQVRSSAFRHIYPCLLFRSSRHTESNLPPFTRTRCLSSLGKSYPLYMSLLPLHVHCYTVHNAQASKSMYYTSLLFRLAGAIKRFTGKHFVKSIYAQFIIEKVRLVFISYYLKGYLYK